MKVWAISDTHNEHERLIIPPDVDMVIHAGDATNHKNPAINANEMLDFIRWFERLPIPHKIFTGGNHETSLEAKMWKHEDFAERGIHLLINQTIEINGIRIFGSPYSPAFNNWAFNCHRGKIGKHWNQIPMNVDVVITHTPAKYLLDTTKDGPQGCGALRTQLSKLENLKFHICGHIHDEGGCTKTSITMPNVTFINAAVVTNFYKVVNNGIIFEI